MITIVCAIVSYSLSTTALNLSYSCNVFDGSVVHGLSTTTSLPLPLGNDKANNKAILDSIAATTQSALGLTVKPDDIYIPFAGNT
jgi:hypothetical protein